MAKKIKYNKVVRIDSIRDMMEKAVAAMGNSTLFIHKKAGKPTEVGCKDFYDQTICLGNALANRGFAEGCHIACVGANSYNWIVTYVSTLCGSNVIVPVDKDLPEKDKLHVIEHSESVVIFCDKAFVPLFTSDAKELAKVKLAHCVTQKKADELCRLIDWLIKEQTEVWLMSAYPQGLQTFIDKLKERREELLAMVQK